MTVDVAERVRRHARHLAPQPTGLEPRLVSLIGLRAVLFDVYGTLLVSGSGDVGTALTKARAEAFADALEAASLPAAPDPGRAVDRLFTVIRSFHESARLRGIDFPEVDIRDVWRNVVADWCGEPPTNDAIEVLTIEYEMRVNPTWPMPGLVEVTSGLASRGLRLGLISNAQFLTPHLFPALTGQDLSALGFAERPRVYSYQHGTAKPGRGLYEIAARQLAKDGIEPSQALYVGNDLLNDIWPAKQVGFRTALFAGDARSLRLREDDVRCRGLEADLLVTALPQLDGCIT